MKSTYQDHEIITPTEARQASPKLANFRVLFYSMAIITAIGVVMLAAFFMSTPPNVEGVPQAQPTVESSPTPAETPKTP